MSTLFDTPISILKEMLLTQQDTDNKNMDDSTNTITQLMKECEIKDKKINSLMSQIELDFNKYNESHYNFLNLT